MLRTISRQTAARFHSARGPSAMQAGRQRRMGRGAVLHHRRRRNGGRQENTVRHRARAAAVLARGAGCRVGCMACASSLALGSQTLRQVLLMCQLRHPNIVSAEDIYLPSDIPAATHAGRAQAPPTAARPDDLFVRMPYYPADLAWLIHSSPQVLTPEHIQARPPPLARMLCARNCLRSRVVAVAVHLRADAERPPVLSHGSLPFHCARARDARWQVPACCRHHPSRLEAQQHVRARCSRQFERAALYSQAG